MREMLNPLPESRAGCACTDRVDSARQAKVFISKKKNLRGWKGDPTIVIGWVTWLGGSPF